MDLYEHQFYLSLKGKWHTDFKQVKISSDCVYPLQGQFLLYSSTICSKDCEMFDAVYVQCLVHGQRSA